MTVYRMMPLWIPIVATITAAAQPPSTPLEPVQVTVVDAEATTHLATFFNVNQRVVTTPDGVFATYLHETRHADEARSAVNEWRLVRSRDGGRSFAPWYVHRRVGANDVIGKAPEIVADPEGNLYLATAMDDQHVHVFRFDRGGSTEPRYARRIRFGGDAPKFSLLYDPRQRRLVVMTASWLLVIDPETGAVVDDTRYRMLTQGRFAYPQYSFLALTDGGDLVAAWHTARFETNYYYDIHWAFADAASGFRAWRDPRSGALLGGAKEPIVCDSSGAAPMINLPDMLSLDGSRTNGLNSMIVKDGKVHFMAGGQHAGRPYQVRYVRCELHGDAPPLRLGAEAIGSPPCVVQGSDGFFCSADTGPASPLFWVTQSDRRIMVLRSDDHGTTWTPHARSEVVADAGRSLYGVVGERRIVDGTIRGLVTDQSMTPPHRVLAFSLATATSARARSAPAAPLYRPETTP